MDVYQRAKALAQTRTGKTSKHYPLSTRVEFTDIIDIPVSILDITMVPGREFEEGTYYQHEGKPYHFIVLIKECSTDRNFNFDVSAVRLGHVLREIKMTGAYPFRCTFRVRDKGLRDLDPD